MIHYGFNFLWMFSKQEHPDDDFIIVGHSAGADAAILAATEFSDKTRIKAMVLLDPTLSASGYGSGFRTAARTYWLGSPGG